MKTLAVFDRKDYDLSLPRFIRDAVRAIINIRGKYAMLYSDMYKFYSFPGGGIEAPETRTDALIREVREETGLIVDKGSVKAFGMTVVIRRDIYKEQIFEHREYYYICGVDTEIAETEMTPEETSSGYRLEFVSLQDAVSLNDQGLCIEKQHMEPEIFIMKLLMESGGR